MGRGDSTFALRDYGVTSPPFCYVRDYGVARSPMCYLVAV